MSESVDLSCWVHTWKTFGFSRTWKTRGVLKAFIYHSRVPHSFYNNKKKSMRGNSQRLPFEVSCVAIYVHNSINTHVTSQSGKCASTAYIQDAYRRLISIQQGSTYDVFSGRYLSCNSRTNCTLTSILNTCAICGFYYKLLIDFDAKKSSNLRLTYFLTMINTFITSHSTQSLEWLSDFLWKSDFMLLRQTKWAVMKPIFDNQQIYFILFFTEKKKQFKN